MKDYIFVAIILIMFVALSIIIPLCLVDKKSKHQEKINKRKEEKNKYTYTWTGCEDRDELDKDLQHMIDELKRLSGSIGRKYQDANIIQGKNNIASDQNDTIIGDANKKSSDKIIHVDKISTLNSLIDTFELYEGQVVYVKEDESSYMWNGKMWNRILFLGDGDE